MTKECSPFRESPLRPTRILHRIRLLTTAAGLSSNPVLGLLINLLVPWNFWTAVIISRYRKHMARLLPVGTKGIGLIATHDLELAHLADVYPQVYNFPFRDAVQEGKLVFDYIIRPGPSPTTNALKIMQMEGLPVS